MKSTFIRNGDGLLLFDFALPGVFRALFLTDFEVSDRVREGAGVAGALPSGTDGFKFSLLNELSMPFVGVSQRGSRKETES
jgi:hypothetical protein